MTPETRWISKEAFLRSTLLDAPIATEALDSAHYEDTPMLTYED